MDEYTYHKKNHSWGSSNNVNNQKAITIECVNDAPQRPTPRKPHFTAELKFILNIDIES